MSISIIIPTKNEAHNLPRLLKSIHTSTAKPIEVIIVDNHSTDDTLKITKQELKNLTLTTKRCKLYTKGLERSSQKNFGAQKATGTHLLFLDADMELPNNLLEELNKLTKKTKAAIIPEKAVGHGFWGKSVSLERNLYQWNKLVEAPRLIQKKLFLSLQGFDEKLIAGEDWDLAVRLQKKSVEFLHTRTHVKHHEPRGFKNNLKRKLYYSKHIKKYSQKHPLQFAKQSSTQNRLNIFWKNRNALLEKPLHTLAFLFIKLIIYTNWKLTQK